MMDYQEAKKTLAGIMNNQATQIYQEWLTMFLEQHPLNTEEQFKEMLSVKLVKMKRQILDDMSSEPLNEPSSDVWEIDLNPSRLDFIRDKQESGPLNLHGMLQQAMAIERYLDKSASGKKGDEFDKIIESIASDWIADPEVVVKSYKLFNGLLFESMHLSEYSMCFDLVCQRHAYPSFKSDQQIKFIYFLSQIVSVNDEVALSKFGILNFRQQKARAVRDTPKIHPLFANKVDRLFRK